MEDQGLYRIGTVAKLTGISAECLRQWERRYGLTPTRRDGKTRYYDQVQLARLTKIKTLIELGHPISSLAELSGEQLDARLQHVRPAPILSSRLPQVGLIGTNLLLLEQESAESDQAEVAQRWVTVSDFTASRSAERAGLDVIAVMLPALNLEDLDHLQRYAPDCRVIAVHRFASESAIAGARASGAQTVVWPVSWDSLMHACATPGGAPLRAGKTAPRRYSDHELLAIVQQAKQRDQDTPRYLVGMINDLNAFTEFSTQQVTENPAATDLYDRIREDTSYARAQLERALSVVAEATQQTSPVD
ncbi:MAG: MerR family transcriptional regulator [Planctomycetota bacterium]|nr:MerR family transcriptional regulator [Planctomycetota bacterium]